MLNALSSNNLSANARLGKSLNLHMLYRAESMLYILCLDKYINKLEQPVSLNFFIHSLFLVDVPQVL